LRTYHAFAATGLLVCGLVAPSSIRAEQAPADEPADKIEVEIEAEAEAETPDLLDTTPTVESDFGFLEQQIYRGEARQAADHLQTMVQQVEATRHRYHEDLLLPLTLLGDALMVQREYGVALEHYERARHIARVSYGLFDPRQLAVVYREAEAYKKVGDLASAGQREEYAYEVLLKAYDVHDPQVLPALMRLGRFYLETYNYLAARTLFNRAMNVHSSNGTDYSIAAVPALQGIALSYRLERFPPYYIATASDNQRLQGPTPGLTNSDLDNQQVSFNSFPAGEKALQQIVEIQRRQDPQDAEATLDAIVALADWHLLFSRNNTAATLYSHVYEQMAEQGEDAAAFFGAPKLIYLPKPSDPTPPDVATQIQPAQGMVELSFNVSTTGRVRKLKTTESQPPKLMDFRVRRSMRLAIYRPKLIEAVPVLTEGETYRHEFEYYPAQAPIEPGDPPVAENNPEAEVSES